MLVSAGRFEKLLQQAEEAESRGRPDIAEAILARAAKLQQIED